MSKTKIFVVYYYPSSHLFSSSIHQPIMAGAHRGIEMDGMIGDHTGDQISELNANLGELTAHYWVWKNYMPSSTDEYIGFCHYRRFLEPCISRWHFHRHLKTTSFDPIFPTWKEEVYQKCMKDCDILLPPITAWKNEVPCWDQYVAKHPVKDLEVTMDILREKYPEYVPYAEKFFAGHTGYYLFCFIMRKEWLENYFQWQFTLIDEMRKRLDWTDYTDYDTVRTPAFIMERLFNVWLNYNVAEKGLRPRNTSIWMVMEKPKRDESWLYCFITMHRRALKEKIIKGWKKLTGKK